jgi:hypothetical protein
MVQEQLAKFPPDLEVCYFVPQGDYENDVEFTVDLIEVDFPSDNYQYPMQERMEKIILLS